MHKTGLGADQVRRVSQGKRSHGLDEFGTPPRPAHDLYYPFFHDLTYQLCYLARRQATRMAQAARPVINPIGGLPKLLRTFETDRPQ